MHSLGQVSDHALHKLQHFSPESSRTQGIAGAVDRLASQSERDGELLQNASILATTGIGSGSLTITPGAFAQRIEGIAGEPDLPVNDEEAVVHRRWVAGEDPSRRTGRIALEGPVQDVHELPRGIGLRVAPVARPETLRRRQYSQLYLGSPDRMAECEQLPAREVGIDDQHGLERPADSLPHVVGRFARHAMEPSLVVFVRGASKRAAMFRAREPGHDTGVLHGVAEYILQCQPYFIRFILVF